MAVSVTLPSGRSAPPAPSARDGWDPSAVRDVFEALVPAYDRFNALASLGLDRLWRRELNARFAPGSRVLDAGTGTGEAAILAAKKGADVTGIDLSPGMIAAARRKPGTEGIRWQVADASRLPFERESFDTVTSSFVLRNLWRAGLLETSLREAARVLVSGGRVHFLDLTRPESALLRWGHRAYLATVLPLIGRSLFGSRWPGAYLSGTIRGFPAPEAFLRALEDAGFASARFQPLTGGIAGIFSAVKP